MLCKQCFKDHAMFTGGLVIICLLLLSHCVFHPSTTGKSVFVRCVRNLCPHKERENGQAMREI